MSIPQSGGGPIERFEQLAEFLASGCKPKAQWTIGTEHEKFGWLTDSHAPLPYDGPRSVKALLEGLRDRFGWTEVLEQGKIIGLTRKGANVSLEPGGQFELSGAMFDSVHQTDAETRNHLAEVAAVAEPMGVRFLGVGAAPEWTHTQMPMMPKGRYRLMTDYMGPFGGGYVGVSDLAELALIRSGAARFWRLTPLQGTPLMVPVAALGAEVLFDAFAALPGLDSQALVAVLAPGAEGDRVLWRRRVQVSADP